ncbi:hypothetical protein [Paenibacillus sp. 1A_MP2]|uniref:hypothetical protein n=1 Tax=Paenibacillus sp. 1A_MP2 TaxID=3457495 RepID=UPI003FCCE0F9
MREDNGQLTQHSDFIYHLEYHVPVQVYDRDTHIEIGLITRFDNQFVEIADTLFIGAGSVLSPAPDTEIRQAPVFTSHITARRQGLHFPLIRKT